MEENDRRVLIDKDLRPAYYDDFHCIMAACRFSCCEGGWHIGMNKKDYLTLKRQSGSPELNHNLEHCVHRVRSGQFSARDYGEIVLQNGACPLWRDGICSLQKEKGVDVLPEVCRTFPRTAEYMPSGYYERSLSPGCEGVLELLWNLPDGIEFRSDPLSQDQCMIAALSGDNPLPLWFSVIREWCVDVLQNRNIPLPQRIWLMGLGLRDLPGIEGDIQRWMEKAAALQNSVDTQNVLPKDHQRLIMYLTTCIRTLAMIQSNNPAFQFVRQELLEGLHMRPDADTGVTTISVEPYQKARARYEERFADRAYFMENLMVALFFHLRMPYTRSKKDLWQGYVNFCNLYAFYRFLSVMSCREDAAGDKDELFRLMVYASRSLIHNKNRQDQLRDELFKNDSATLAHMAVLLCG